MPKPTRAQLVEALETIAMTPLVSYEREVEGKLQPVVTLERANDLRQVAKEALHPEEEHG